jgi:uncharacterized protein (TIGR02996 family)
MELSLSANPDDLTTHMAYADLLSEQGDPRGEFISVQLALEDPSRPPEERKRLQAREAELLAAHQTEWLGEVAPMFLRPPETFATAPAEDVFGMELYRWSRFEVSFARGWVDRLFVCNLNPPFAQALGKVAVFKLLGSLIISDNDHDTSEATFAAVAKWPGLACLRSFQAGDEERGQGNGKVLGQVLVRMPRLEELHLHMTGLDVSRAFALNLPNLRVLHVYHQHNYPLEVLARNSSMGNLVTLVCRPHALEPQDEQGYIQPGPFGELCHSSHLKCLTHLEMVGTDIGDEGCRALVESGMLRRLRVLDLTYGRITDEGAQLLADCPDLRKLERLVLKSNMLTSEGIAALTATGVHLEASEQFDPDSMDENEHLWYGDCE